MPNNHMSRKNPRGLASLLSFIIATVIAHVTAFSAEPSAASNNETALTTNDTNTTALTPDNKTDDRFWLLMALFFATPVVLVLFHSVIQAWGHRQKEKKGLKAAKEKQKQETLREFKDMVLAMMIKNGMTLQSAPKGLRADKEVVTAAVTNNGQAFQFASKELQADKGLVLAMVKLKGMALKHASEALRDNPAVVQAAVTQDGMALEFASKALRADKAIVLSAVKTKAEAFRFANVNMRHDPTFILDVMKQNSLALKHAPESLRNDSGFMLAVVKQNGMALLLQFAGVNLRKNPSFMADARKQNKEAHPDFQRRTVFFEAEKTDPHDTHTSAATPC